MATHLDGVELVDGVGEVGDQPLLSVALLVRLEALGGLRLALEEEDERRVHLVEEQVVQREQVDHLDRRRVLDAHLDAPLVLQRERELERVAQDASAALLPRGDERKLGGEALGVVPLDGEAHLSTAGEGRREECGEQGGG